MSSPVSLITKTGFGNINGVVDGSTGFFVALNFTANRSKRIFDITCGYSLTNSDMVAGKYIVGGRLLVIGQQITDGNLQIGPFLTILPDSIASAQIFFDIPIYADLSNSSQGPAGVMRNFTFPNGLIIPDSVEASIILTYPVVQSVQGNANLYLNANGLIGGSDKIYKDA